MFNGKKYTTSENGQRRVNKIADIYTQQRNKVYSRAETFNTWVVNSNSRNPLNGKLLFTGLLTGLLLLIGLSLVLYRYVAFESASPSPAMNQVKHARHIRERILEDQAKKATPYPSVPDSTRRILSPKK